MKTGNNRQTRQQIRLNILRFLLSEERLLDDDYRSLVWYRIWFFHSMNDIGAPRYQQIPYTKTPYSQAPFSPDVFSETMKTFHKLQKELRITMKTETALLENIFEQEKRHDMDAPHRFLTLSPENQNILLCAFSKVAKAIQYHRKTASSLLQKPSGYKGKSSALKTPPVS